MGGEPVAPRAGDATLRDLRDTFNALPVAAHLGARCAVLERGRATVTMTSPADLRNPNGAVAGPYLSGLADMAAGMAVGALLGGHGHVTLELTLRFLRPALADPLEATGEVLWRGGRHAFVTVDVRDADHELCAHATGTWALNAVTDVPGSPP
jgi:uncharacterized protein (TIGR00369 family)